MSTRRVLVVVFCAVFVSCAFAADPPGRAARLNYMSGQVSIQPGGANDWVAGNLNRPLTSGDRIWADRDSRAEVQLGAAVIRLNSNTSVTLANVSDNAVQIQVDEGTLNLHVMKLYRGEIYEIDTPNLAFTVAKSGDYRFDVNNAGDTTSVTVWKGKGDVTGDGPVTHLEANQRATFSNGRSLQRYFNNSPGMDGFDDWCHVRAQREDQSASLRYVSPYAVGYSDLDDYGYWQTISPYGPVWVPRGVAYDWAPYRYGHWVWISPWGWTWVDDAPWGFAPFHYGRWVHFSGYWGWCPGPVYVRPIWAPALVAWFGGPGWGVSFGIGGGVGWVPLGWGEPYIPYYHHSRGYFRNVNVSNTHITNITYITNNYYGGHNVNNIHYVNRNVPGAFTAVPTDTLIKARPTRGVARPISGPELKTAAMMTTVPVRPTRDSVMGPGQGTSPAARPIIATRPVVTRMTPPERPTTVPGVEVGRPTRSVQTVPSYAPPAVTQTNPSRVIPRPPQKNRPVTMAEEESPRGVPMANVNVNRGSPANSLPARVPHPTVNSEATKSVEPGPNAPNSLPARVPRPPIASQEIRQGTGRTNAPAVAAPANIPSAVPRPPQNVTPARSPEHSTPDTAVRESSRPAPQVYRPESVTRPTPQVYRPESVTRSAPQVYRPESTPRPSPQTVTRNDRSGSHAPTVYSAPPSAPVRTSSPPSAAPSHNASPPASHSAPHNSDGGRPSRSSKSDK